MSNSSPTPKFPRIAPSLPGLQTPTTADFLTARPYFLVPFSGNDGSSEGEDRDRADVEADLATFLAKADPITDVFILCHGWHRNLCSGVAAYDRLMSRFALLVSRGRINPQQDFGKDFNPLFLGVHWNSDPSMDDWVDTAGRRDKTSFIQQMRLVFAPTPTQESDFLRDSEDAFALMSQVSAPGGAPGTPNPQLTNRLMRYSVRGAAQPMTAQTVVCTVWRCYFESTPMAFLEPQGAPPEPVGGPDQAFSTLAKFVLGFVAMVAIVTAVLGPFWKWLGFPLESIKTEVLKPARWLHGPTPPPYCWHKVAIIAGVALCGYGVLRIAELVRGKKRAASSGVPLQALFGAPAQIVAALPILAFLLFTYLFRSAWSLGAIVLGVLGWYGLAAGWLVFWFIAGIATTAAGIPLSGVFREKLKAPEDDAISVREVLVAPAFDVVTRLKSSVGSDSAIYRMATGIQNQFAFFKMQRRGVSVGCQVGTWLAKDFAKMLEGHKAEDPVRIHFIGHSFGTLVITNAVRTLAQLAANDGQSYKSKVAALFYFAGRSDPLAKVKSNVMAPGLLFQSAPKFRMSATPAAGSWAGNHLELRSVILLQGAIASDWFQNETALRHSVTGRVGCVYSAYDTANGFYYPFSNNGRMAAGYVGLFGVGAAQVGGGGQTALIVEPPLFAPGPGFFNFDASRLIYNGSPASGGGHDDIFKDDVVNLIWGLVR